MEQASDLLLRALSDASTEQAALTELKLAGRRATSVLERARTSTAVTAKPAVHAEVLALLVQFGDDDALETLTRLPATDATVLAWQLTHAPMNAIDARLVQALTHASARVRVAALRRVRSLERTAPIDAEIDQLASHDPAPAVRSAAIEVMAERGAIAFDSVATFTADADPQVRDTAMAAAAELDCERTYARLAEAIAGAASQQGLSAARALARCGADITESARGQLQRALSDSRVPLRAEAASSTGAFAWSELPEWLIDVLRHDPVSSVRLALALSLVGSQRDVAAAHLIALSRTRRSMVSLQAAAWLAENERDAKAAQIVHEALTHGDARMQQVAARALGRTGRHTAALVTAMASDDVAVRLAAAGALVAGPSPGL